MPLTAPQDIADLLNATRTIALVVVMLLFVSAWIVSTPFACAPLCPHILRTLELAPDTPPSSRRRQMSMGTTLAMAHSMTTLSIRVERTTGISIMGAAGRSTTIVDRSTPPCTRSGCA